MQFLKAFVLSLFLIPTSIAEIPSKLILNFGLPNNSSDTKLFFQNFFEPEKPEINIEALEPDQSKEFSIESQNSQSFYIDLKSRQFAQIDILKSDLNLKIKIYEPSGAEISEIVNIRFGDITVHWISENEGRYIIKIISLEQSVSGKYTPDYSTPRTATEKDRKFIKFAQLFNEGEKLFMAENQKSLKLALEKYQAAFAGFEQLQSFSEAARSAGRIGEVFSIWGNNKKAYEYFKTAYTVSQKSNDKILPVAFLNLMGRSLIYLDKMSKARQIIEKVFSTIQRERGEVEARKILFEEGNARLNIGEIFYSEGDLPESLINFRSAVQKFKEIGDRHGQVSGHLLIGYSLSDLGYIEEASGSYQQALALLSYGFDIKDRALLLNAIGAIHFARGEIHQSLKFHNEALFSFHQLGDTQNEGVTLNGIARVYNELNEPKIAYEIFHQSLRLFEINSNNDFQSTTLLSMGRNCKILGKNDEALRHYRKSFELSRFLGKKRVAAYALNFIAELADATGDPVGAAAELKKSLKIFEIIGDRKGQAETFNSIGSIYRKNQKYLPALQFYRQSLKISRIIGEKKIEAQSLYNIALTNRAIGELEEALENIEQALSIIESLRILIANEMLRMSYFSMVTEYYDFYINLLMQLDKIMPGSDYKIRAWQANEKVRSRILLESLYLGGVEINPTQNPELNLREEKLARLINDKINLHSNLIRQNKPFEKINQSMQELRRLFIDYEEIRDEIKKEDSSLKSIASIEETDLATVKEFMRDEPDSVLLEYLLTDEKSYLWTITSDKIESYELPSRSDIEKTSLEYYQLVSTSSHSSSAEAKKFGWEGNSSDEFITKACQLSQMLIPSGVLPPDKKRLLIVPDKTLNYVSFDALPISCDTEIPFKSSTDASSYLPLITRFETSITPSATTSTMLRKKIYKNTGATNLVAIFADPVFEPGDSDMPLNQKNSWLSNPEDDISTNTQPENSLTRLIYSSQEADQIIGITSSENSLLLSRFDANLNETKNPRIKNYQILHFATHSLANDEIPELSGIYLSQFNKSGESIPGVLRLQNIYDLNINAKLIVLSSCNSAVGHNVSGEGLISLSRGFMSAGAESVVGSLWKVDDQASAELMKYFYEFLIYDKMSLSEALRNAKLKMSAQKKWQSPYYWSGFVLQGEHINKIESDNYRRSDLWMTVKLLFVTILIIGVIFTLKKLKKR